MACNRTNQQITARTFLLLSVLELVVIGYCLFWIRSFNYDEFESIHSGWKILNGEKIYEEFQQIHNPLLYYFLACIIRFFGETLTSIHASAIIIFAMACGCIAFIYLIARDYFDRDTAVLSVILLPLIPWFTMSAFEIRPDVPMLLFGLASMYYLNKYFQASKSGYLIASSVFLGISYLFLQKAVLFILLVTGILAHRLITGKISLRHTLVYISILILVYLLFLSLLSLDTSLNSYFFFTFEFVRARGAHIGYTENSEIIFNEITNPNRLLWILFPLFLHALYLFRKNRQKLELALCAVLLISSVFFMPVPSDHYWLPGISISSIIIAYGFRNIAEKFLSQWTTQVLFVIVISGCLNTYLVFSENAKNRGHQLARIDYVISNTDSTDYVYDGSIIFNLFRKDLDFFWLRGHKRVPAVETYQLIKPYDYDIYRQILDKDPKIVSYRHIDLRDRPDILEKYCKSVEFPDLYIRCENNTGYPFWYSYHDKLGTGSSVKPQKNFFNASGDLEVTLAKAANPDKTDKKPRIYPYSGIGVSFKNRNEPVDLMYTSGVFITYKLNGPVIVILDQPETVPGNEFFTTLPPASDYTTIFLRWNDFRQPGRLEDSDFPDREKISGLKFQVSSPDNISVDLAIRNIKLAGQI